MGRTIEPRFLAVAFEERMISRINALRVGRSQQAYRDAGIEPPPVGEAAVDLHILTGAQVSAIIELQKEYKTESKRCRDPWAGQRLYHRLRQMKSPSRIMAGLLIIGTMATAAYFSNHRWQSAGAAGTISTALLVALNLIAPKALTRPIVWDRIVVGLLILAAPVSIVYCAWMAHLLKQAAQVVGNSAPPDLIAVESLWRRLVWSGAASAACFVSLAVMAFWQRRGVRLHNDRICRMGQLVTVGCRALAELQSAPKTEHVHDRVQQLLKKTAGIMLLNPWTRFLARILFWKKEVEAVFLWYLEPETEQLKHFNIVAFTAPTAGDSLLRACQSIKRNHHPVLIDLERYTKVFRRCTTKDGVDKRRFLANPEKSDFVSLTGHVYASGQCFPSGDADDCLEFDRSYADALEPGELTKEVARWLNFNSLCAYPVFRNGDNTDEVMGVLVGFRIVRNGIIPADEDALLTLSCLLGLILSQGDGHPKGDAHGKTGRMPQGTTPVSESAGSAPRV